MKTGNLEQMKFLIQTFMKFYANLTYIRYNLYQFNKFMLNLKFYVFRFFLPSGWPVCNEYSIAVQQCNNAFNIISYNLYMILHKNEKTHLLPI